MDMSRWLSSSQKLAGSQGTLFPNALLGSFLGLFPNEFLGCGHVVFACFLAVVPSRAWMGVGWGFEGVWEGGGLAHAQKEPPLCGIRFLQLGARTLGSPLPSPLGSTACLGHGFNLIHTVLNRL